MYYEIYIINYINKYIINIYYIYIYIYIYIVYYKCYKYIINILKTYYL